MRTDKNDPGGSRSPGAPGREALLQCRTVGLQAGQNDTSVGKLVAVTCAARRWVTPPTWSDRASGPREPSALGRCLRRLGAGRWHLCGVLRRGARRGRGGGERGARGGLGGVGGDRAER